MIALTSYSPHLLLRLYIVWSAVGRLLLSAALLLAKIKSRLSNNLGLKGHKMAWV